MNLVLDGKLSSKICSPAPPVQPVETAKAKGLRPYYCLRYLFERLPVAEAEDDYRTLLPQNLSPEQITLPAA